MPKIRFSRKQEQRKAEARARLAARHGTGVEQGTSTLRSVSGRWQPGQNGNADGRPAGERALLRKLYGANGAKLVERLQVLRDAKGTPADVKARIDMYLLDRLAGVRE